MKNIWKERSFRILSILVLLLILVALLAPLLAPHDPNVPDLLAAEQGPSETTHWELTHWADACSPASCTGQGSPSFQVY